MSNFNTKSDGKSFDEATIEAVWQKGKLEPRFRGFRKDAYGASMQRTNYGKQEEPFLPPLSKFTHKLLHYQQEHWGWEIDHIKPVSKGGTDDLSNLQPLQWENNRRKGDNYPGSFFKVRS